eukprot:m.111340 g.111340  ORF g.111340 m.111340 type:complete len:125 (+) comp37423_c0_seq8:30-404(+)
MCEQLPLLLSKRGMASLGKGNVIKAGFKLWQANPYDPQTNPKGVIPLETSSNRTIFDIIKAKMDVSSSVQDWTTDDMDYTGGFPRIKSVMAEFLTARAEAAVPLQADDVSEILCGSCLAWTESS